MRSLRRLLPLLLVVLASPARAGDVLVFAAASFADALKEVGQQYEPASGNKLIFNLAASSVLARQIKEGAPADLFISADEAKMDDLAAAGNFREAVRHLYLALLSRLHRAGAIDYDPTLSNWDYCRGFRGRREWLPTFRELTLRFDFAWYGSTEVGQDGYLAFRSMSQPILAPDEVTPDA